MASCLSELRLSQIGVSPSLHIVYHLHCICHCLGLRVRVRAFRGASDLSDSVLWSIASVCVSVCAHFEAPRIYPILCCGASPRFACPCARISRHLGFIRFCVVEHRLGLRVRVRAFRGTSDLSDFGCGASPRFARLWARISRHLGFIRF
ncbi:hypothetical protein LOK49_LG15G01406 [Camellia lanceoleosa]|uniref:Uncharacterized protein n=1 Tax=Camellia lanceoleosa TaxID=1840588 RepID=A0ACC0F1C8_9ERIC|nr:hypothetical protein LOK49_LG15G01406 [Camellia lanceoleosa]